MSDRPGLLLIGGGGGFVGRHLLPELRAQYRIRSLHRHPVRDEAGPGVEWIAGDAGEVERWEPLLDGVEVVVNLAWYRAGSERRFRRLGEGLSRLVESIPRSTVRRVIQLSVPAAPADLESGLPYLVHKRAFDRRLAASGVSYRVLRPTMMYGTGDVLVGEMRGLMQRYGRFPMFGDGEYGVSPVWAGDLASLVVREASGDRDGTIDLGGPRTYRYRDLTDLLFRSVGRTPRYWSLSRKGSLRLARCLELVGSHRLYRYEVEWLMSGMLALPGYPDPPRPLRTLEDYLTQSSPDDRSSRPTPASRAA